MCLIRFYLTLFQWIVSIMAAVVWLYFLPTRRTTILLIASYTDIYSMKSYLISNLLLCFPPSHLPCLCVVKVEIVPYTYIVISNHCQYIFSVIKTERSYDFVLSFSLISPITAIHQKSRIRMKWKYFLICTKYYFIFST